MQAWHISVMAGLVRHAQHGLAHDGSPLQNGDVQMLQDKVGQLVPWLFEVWAWHEEELSKAFPTGNLFEYLLHT